MKKYKRVYVEITNICNLNCSFCPKNSRDKKFMTTQQFEYVAKQISPLTDNICLHLMGEPLLHPNLNDILKTAEQYNLNVNLTTNGTLLKQNCNLLLSNKIRKISVSLHSFEANKQNISLSEYLSNVIETCSLLNKKTNTIIEFRLWNNNQNSNNKLNETIINTICKYFNANITLEKNVKNYTIKHNVFLGFEDVFEWPITTTNKTKDDCKFCYALKTHFGILCDGTVVPCCLDSEGRLALGNIFKQNINEILSCQRAKDLRKGFANRKINESFCKTCSYAKRFDKN
ncbi:MAG: radical SAM/SPASM domain-containing protein [Christensenellales bacterium]